MPLNRQRKLDAVVTRLQLKFGPAAIRRAVLATEPITHLSTTFLALDGVLGGGLPRGRITEIIGPVTSGKVTLAAKALAAAQQNPDTLVAWLDLSRTCDPEYLHRCGVDLSRLLVVHPRDGSDALAVALYLVASNTLDALVCDGTSNLARADPAIVAGSLERLATIVTRTQTAIIFLTEPHAQANTLAHAATVQLALQRERWIMRGNDVRGYAGQVEILKHRLRPAGAVVPIRITFNGTVRGE